jgi:hypothetical protein
MEKLPSKFCWVFGGEITKLLIWKIRKIKFGPSFVGHKLERLQILGVLV